MTTKATLGQVNGALDKDQRGRVRHRVALAVDGWIDAAYGGDYPRTDFADAFAVFSENDGARRAHSDRDVMSNAGLGEDVDAVTFTRRRLRIDVLAHRGAAVAVTARVLVRMDISGARPRRERVTGALYLTYEKSAWRVFGYNMDRGEV